MDQRRFARQLKAWFKRHQRMMPWRATGGHWPNPYHVLVAETMLQQTQVNTVVDYFHRFIEAFPNLSDLAGASEQQVLRHWQGLGYYRRARHLHAAAKQCVDQHGGDVPASVEELGKLPGVGRYTAGAVSSMAYGRPTPIVDGNVARVLSRLFAIDQPIDKSATQRQLWQRAENLVPRHRPDRFNQAMMELGSLICTPTQPQCLSCPVREHCLACERGQVDVLPVQSPKRAKQAVRHTVIAVERGNRLLFEKRPPGGLWSNMWQMPSVEAGVGQHTTAKPGTTELCQHVQSRFGLEVDAESAEPVGQFTHQTTHRHIEFLVYHTQVRGGRLKPGAGLWRRATNVDDLPLANPQRRALSLIDTNAS